MSANEGKSTEIILEHVPSLGDKKCWNNKQISDFVRKLGFLDQEKEEGKQIKRFLNVSEVKSLTYNISIQLVIWRIRLDTKLVNLNLMCVHL